MQKKQPSKSSNGKNRFATRHHSLNFSDVIVEVNKRDLLWAKVADLMKNIQKIRDANDPLKLLVMEKRRYGAIIRSNGKIEKKNFSAFNGTKTVPFDFANTSKKWATHQFKSRLEFPSPEIVSGKDDVGD